MVSLCLPDWTEIIRGIKVNILFYSQRKRTIHFSSPHADYNSVTKLQYYLYHDQYISHHS